MTNDAPLRAASLPVVELHDRDEPEPRSTPSLGISPARCPLCGGHPEASVGTKDGLRILRCDTCTLQYSEHVPSLADIRALYDEHYFHGAPTGYPDYARDEPLHRARARQYLRDLSPLVPTAGRVLDVGCATGFFLDEARRAGWSVTGWEVSDWAAGYARDRLGIDVLVGAFPAETSAVGTFDLVTFFNVFEQLPSARAAEQRLRELVRPGGVVALETWDATATVVRLLGMRWHKYRPRETPFYLNRQALAVLFDQTHWEMLRYEPRTKWISLRHGLHALGLVDREASPSLLGRALELQVPYRLGDLVWTVFRRRDSTD